MLRMQAEDIWKRSGFSIPFKVFTRKFHVRIITDTYLEGTTSTDWRIWNATYLNVYSARIQKLIYNNIWSKSVESYQNIGLGFRFLENLANFHFIGISTEILNHLESKSISAASWGRMGKFAPSMHTLSRK